MEADTAFLASIADKIKKRVSHGKDENTKPSKAAPVTFGSPSTPTSEPAPLFTFTPRVSVAQDTIMGNTHDGPSLRGTAEQLETARQIMNSRAPKLRHARSSGSVASRYATVPARMPPESRRYHPQMGLGASNAEFTFNTQKSPVKLTIPEQKISSVAPTFTPQAPRIVKGVFSAQNTPTAGSILDVTNPSTLPKAVSVGASTSNVSQPSNTDASMKERTNKPEVTPSTPVKLNISTAGAAGQQSTEPKIAPAEAGNLQSAASETVKQDHSAVKTSQGSATIPPKHDIHDNGKKPIKAISTSTGDESISKLNDAIASLRSELYDTQRRLEVVIQGEERRRFLGTDHPKTPYEITVICRKSKHQIQVDATMRVSELIRRIRLALKIAPHDSLNPRIVLDGSQIGHGMMLGETGIVLGKEVQFVFSGVDDVTV